MISKDFKGCRAIWSTIKYLKNTKLIYDISLSFDLVSKFDRLSSQKHHL